LEALLLTVSNGGRFWMKCDGCDVDVIDVQSKMVFRALPAGEDWSECPRLSECLRKMGKRDFHVAVPTQFAV